MEVGTFPGPAGPSRPRRMPGSGEQDLGDRIVAMQRRQATAGAGAAGPTSSRSRRPASPAVDEFSRSPRASGSRLFDPKVDSPLPLPKSPLPAATPAPRQQVYPDPHRGQRVHSPGPSRREAPRSSEYHRGPPDSHRALYDPSQPTPPPRSGPSSHVVSGAGSSRTYQSQSRSELTPPSQHRHHDEHRSSRPDPSRALFDPNQHDPIQFHGRIDAPSLSGSGHGSSRSFPRVNGRSREEEMDRERERRKRKEGSERGMAKKKDSGDTRSKGSKSSEGSESFKDRERGKGRSDGGVKAFLKDVYDKIKALELELNEIHKTMANDTTSVSRDADLTSKKAGVVDTAAWLDLIVKHKKLSDLHHEFLVRLFDPLVPSSLHQLTVRYNIPSRLWQSGFHLILERLRHAWMSDQPAALDLLTDLVYDAYKFYTDLLEDQTLVNFRTAWIEALGDLARYRMAIASHQAIEASTRPVKVSERDGDWNGDGSDGASIGAEVAQHWDVEDKETWRTTARDWYSMGITEKPGEGRLHHHLALLSRDIRGQEPRALHHFTKSLTVTHAFESARESILPLFDSALQSQRSLPDATAMDLFVRLHGMLFTRIQLDDLPTVMSRFLERLEEDASLDGVSRKATITQVDWMLMATTNITALLQYGSGLGIIRKALAQEGAERRRQHASATGEGEEEEDGQISGESDGHHQSPTLDQLEPTLSFSSALELSFAILDHCLQHPRRLQGMTYVLNPYITLSLTFMATLFRQSHVGSMISPGLPWVRLVDFINTCPDEIREEARLVNGAPLPEDWCIRGMEWVGRRVYERGFWKAKGSGRGSGAMAQPKLGERFSSEMDVLLANFDSAVDSNEGVVDEIDGTDLTDGPVAVNQRRWRRVAWAAGVLVKHVDGLELVDGRVVIRGVLADKLAEVEAERMAKADRINVPPPIPARVLEEMEELDLESESEGEDPDLAVLRERRRHLRSLVNGNTPGAPITKTKHNRSKTHRLQVIPGYTMLVFDTNVLLSSLSLFAKLVESGIWSIVVPLPVVTELDGLSKEPAPLGPSAKQAVQYLESRIRTHSLCLKIQTTKGNYLSDLLIRTENHDRSADERTMDDRILNIAAFQQEHFVDRSTILGGRKGGVEATKVVLVTFDRNLRLKARARGVDAADEKEMAGIMGKV